MAKEQTMNMVILYRTWERHPVFFWRWRWVWRVYRWITHPHLSTAFEMFSQARDAYGTENVWAGNLAWDYRDDAWPPSNYRLKMPIPEPRTRRPEPQ